MQCLQAIFDLFFSHQSLTLLCLFAQAGLAYKQWQLLKNIHEYNALSNQVNMTNLKLKDDLAITLLFCKSLVEQLDFEMKEIENGKSSWALLSYHYSKTNTETTQIQLIVERHQKNQYQLCPYIKNCLDNLEKALVSFKEHCAKLYEECRQDPAQKPKSILETQENMMGQYNILKAHTKELEKLLKNKTYFLG